MVSFSAKKKERVAMKRRYQIEQQRAVQQFRRIANEQNPNIQMILPLADIVGLLQQGVGNLLRQAGLELMHLVMDQEVKSLAGERHQQHEGRRAHRWGKEDGYCVVDGQKVPIQKTRLRTPDKREQRLGSYELFQRSGPLQAGVWDKMMRGLSTRNYGAVVKDFQDAYGIEKSKEELATQYSYVVLSGFKLLGRTLLRAVGPFRVQPKQVVFIDSRTASGCVCKA